MKGADTIFHLLSPINRLAYSLTPPQTLALTGIETNFMTFCVGLIKPNSMTLTPFSEALDNPDVVDCLVCLQGYSKELLIKTAKCNGLEIETIDGRTYGVLDGAQFEVSQATSIELKDSTEKRATTQFRMR